MKFPAPKYATPRNHSLPTLGGVAAAVATQVRGKKPMPWQQHVLEVSHELSREYPGEYQYQTVIVSVPRQSGKSHMLGDIHTHRMLAFRNHLAVMTAQTGKDASKRWKQITDSIATEDPDLFDVKRGNGSQIITYKPTGSSLSPFAPRASAVHGDSLALASIDEAWAFSEVQGNDLEGAISPTFLTVPNSQLWIVSTRGTANSAWLNSLIEKGRAAIHDPSSRIAYFEWSADETLADADPYSDETLAFHPAIGHTQSARKIRDVGAKASLGEWRRAYLNLPTEQTETAIDMAVWASLAWNYDPEVTERIKPQSPADYVLAWDTASDGSAATIAAAWLNNDGHPETQIIATAPGTHWLRKALEDLSKKGYRAIISDDSGSNRTIHTDLANSPAKGQVIGWKEYGSACQALLDRIREGTITHDAHSAVSKALYGTSIRRSGNVQVIDVAKSTSPQDALRATAIAAWAASENLATPLMQIF
ncbi:hypothetical protein [Arcanobacterium haemolyticum]